MAKFLKTMMTLFILISLTAACGIKGNLNSPEEKDIPTHTN